MSFFTIHEFKEWSNTRSDMHLWRVKYYKGLGTSSNEEALEYFGNLRKHQLEFVYINEVDDKSIELAFSKKLADQRKDWINNYNEDDFIDHS